MNDKALQRFKEKVRGVVDFAAIASALVIGYVGITVAVNIPSMAAQAGIEYLLDQPKQEMTGILKEKKETVLPGTHSDFYTGIFELSNGEVQKVNDNYRMLEGKIIGNTIIPHLVVGKEYQLTTIGSENLGYTLLEAREIE